MANTIVTLSGDDAELYKAFQRILDSQKKVDEGYDKIRAASRRAAKEAEAAAKEEAREQQRRREQINEMAGSVLSLGTSYLSVNTAVQAVSKSFAELRDNQNAALETARALAAAQQEAAKNLAGKTPREISETLQTQVPAIAKRATFADLPALTTALGAAASIVGEEQALGVVEQSARLTRFTPGELQTTATATADLLNATGLSDARQGLALLASAGSVARPEQLAKLATGAAVAANAAIGEARNQNPVDAAKEGIALYAKLSKLDPQGQSAATATNQLIAQVSKLFTDPATDPGTFTGRLAAIRANPELSAQITGSLTGEAKFLPLFKQLIAGGNQFSSEFDTALAAITTDPRVFEQVATSTVATPQAAIAEAELRSRVGREIAKATDVRGQIRAAVRNESDAALSTTSTGLLTGVSNFLTQGIGRNMVEPTQGTAEFFLSEQMRLNERIGFLGATQGRPEQIDAVAAALKAIDELARLPELLEALRLEGVSSNEFLRQQNKLQEETKRALEQAVSNRAPPPAAVRAQAAMETVGNADWGGTGAGMSGGSW